MKKVLNFFGIFFSILLSIILTILLFGYALILNAKILVSKQGVTKMFTNTDFVEIIKEVNHGRSWHETVKLANDINIT